MMMFFWNGSFYFSTTCIFPLTTGFCRWHRFRILLWSIPSPTLFPLTSYLSLLNLSSYHRILSMASSSDPPLVHSISYPLTSYLSLLNLSSNHRILSVASSSDPPLVHSISYPLSSYLSPLTSEPVL